MSIQQIKSHFINWREWEMNPIVIKELRQGVRSWTVTGMLLLFLVVLFITAIGFLVTQSFDVNPDMRLGGSMFSAFMVILAGASVFFIPLYTGVRVAAERQENNPDLLYVTTLSPFRIVLGKFLCSAYLAVLFFSACMPFMAFTNLLRGVDLPTVFFILGFLFIIVCAANMIAIFLACLPMSRPFKFLFVIYGIFQSISVIGSAVAMSYGIMRSGVGAMMSGRDFWIGAATALGVVLMLIGLFFVLAVALVSPQSANRALPVRIYLTVMWVVGGVLAFSWVAQTGDAERMAIWTYPTFGMMMFALLVSISNADHLSLRVRRTIPKSAFKRFFAFFFFNGAAGGVVWVGTILVATYLLTYLVLAAFPKPRFSAFTVGADNSWFSTSIAYVFSYALTALFIHRKFLSKRPAKLTGLLAVLLAGGWALAPSVFLFFANRLSWKSVDGLQLGNVFNLFTLRDSSQYFAHQMFAFGWLFLALLLNAKWFAQQVKNFRPPAPVTAENAPPVLQ